MTPRVVSTAIHKSSVNIGLVNWAFDRPPWSHFMIYETWHKQDLVCDQYSACKVYVKFEMTIESLFSNWRSPQERTTGPKVNQRSDRYWLPTRSFLIFLTCPKITVTKICTSVALIRQFHHQTAESIKQNPTLQHASLPRHYMYDIIIRTCSSS